MKSTSLETVIPYRPDLEEKMESFESHYPFFTWNHREAIDLETGSGTRWALAQLAAASKQAQHLTRDQRLELLRQPDRAH
jgi:hypothetical protein